MCFSVENGGKGGVFHEVNAAGALMKFAYDTMWGVSALVPFFLFFFDGLLMDLLCALAFTFPFLLELWEMIMEKFLFFSLFPSFFLIPPSPFLLLFCSLA